MTRLHGSFSYERRPQSKPVASTIFPLALRANSSRKTKLLTAQGPPLRFGLAPPTALRFYCVLWRSSRKAIANGASPQ